MRSEYFALALPFMVLMSFQTYYSIASELHAREMKLVMSAYLDASKKSTDDGEDISTLSLSPMGAYND